jgi:phosphoglycerol transferase MdoB-like AlkP superfamily enzyme
MPLDAFVQVSLILGVTTIIAWVAKLLRQPLLIAYIVAGILSGPVFFNIFSGEQELYSVFAKFGVVFLLFVVSMGNRCHPTIFGVCAQHAPARQRAKRNQKYFIQPPPKRERVKGELH